MSLNWNSLRRAAPLSDISFLSLSPFQPSSPVFFSFRGRASGQNWPATPNHLLSPLIFFIVHGSRSPQPPPPPTPSQSIISRTINRSQPPNPSLLLATSLLLTGWVWPLTPCADSSISFLWQQSQQRKTERGHTRLCRGGGGVSLSHRNPSSLLC